MTESETDITQDQPAMNGLVAGCFLAGAPIIMHITIFG